VLTYTAEPARGDRHGADEFCCPRAGSPGVIATALLVCCSPPRVN
jgi:hypothetical protein